MSENNFGFGKFVPGFDFLQNIAKGTSSIPQMPSLANWVAPTLNVEELDKRISELKAVHFWLDQNSKALGATIQALEVQKMTLATLKGMNLNMSEMANALKVKTADSFNEGMQRMADAAGAAKAASGGNGKAKEPEPVAPAEAKPAAAVVDPLQWWGALTQQFQEIASNAMNDVAQKNAVEAARTMAAGAAKEAMKATSGMVKAATDMARVPGTRAAKAPASAPARKAAPRKTKAKTKAAPKAS